MAKFQIMTPGGYEVEVTADTQEEALNLARENWQTMPRLIARQEGDVRVFERPNGDRYVVTPVYSTTDPDQVAEILAAIERQQPVSEVVYRSFDEDIIAAHPIASRGSQFIKGLGLTAGSYADEAIGAVFGDQAAAGTRALQAAMERQRPGETLALNLGGAGVGLLGAGAAIGPQAIASGAKTVTGSGRLLPQAVRGLAAGSAAGAVEGGIYGAGEGTDTASRVQEAQSGAVFGGLTGGALGAASPYVRQGVENVTARLRQSDVATIASTLGISQNAARVIRNTFQMGGDVDSAVSRLQSAGDEAMLADAGEAAQALLDATKASGAQASQAVSSALDERMTRTAAQLGSGLTDRLGMPAAGPQTAVREIMQGSQEARGQAYDAAYSAAIDYASPQGREIEAVLSRIEPNILQSAINEANAEMIDRGLANQQILAEISETGAVSFSEMPNVRQLDMLKRALDDAARSARRSEGILSVDTSASLRATRQAADLRNAIVQATGGSEGPYAQALRIGGDTVAEREAFMLGERLLNTSTRVEDVMLTLGDNPSRAALDAAKRGLRTRIEEIVGNVRRIPSDPNIDARQALAALREMSSENARRKISRLMGDEAQDIFDILDQASIAAETRTEKALNNSTAIRQSIQGDVDELTAPGVVGNVMSGEPINATKSMVQAITGQTSEYTAAQRQELYQDLARALTNVRGDDAVTALRVLDEAMRGQQLTDAQTEQLSNLITSALFGAGTMQIPRNPMTNDER